MGLVGEELSLSYLARARNWPRLIVRDDQQSGKDKFSFNELVLLDECPCLTIIRTDK